MLQRYVRGTAADCDAQQDNVLAVPRAGRAEQGRRGGMRGGGGSIWGIFWAVRQYHRV